MTGALAIYAAVMSTIVFIWDIVKWRRSERVRLYGFVSSNMQAFGSAETPITRGNTYSILRLSNRGKVACQLSIVEMRAYPNVFKRMFGKPSMQALVNHHKAISGYDLPHRLEPGGDFASSVLQNAEFERLSRESRLYLGVNHSMSNKPFLVRVPPIKEEPTTAA